MIEDFKVPEFEPKTYANKILAESKLGQGLQLESHISQLNLKIQEIVLNSHHELISNTSFAQLETLADEFSTQLSATQNKFQIIKDKSLNLWTEMAAKAKDLEIEHQRAQIAKALIRFLTLSKRLETAGQSDWHIVSGLVNECCDIVQEHDLMQIDIVKEKWKFFQHLTGGINQHASSLLSESIGNSQLDHVILGLGIFLNLKKLDVKVEEILNLIIDNVSKMVQDGLNVEQISSKLTSNCFLAY